LEFLIFEI
jgi:transcription elongation factor Elf1